MRRVFALLLLAVVVLPPFTAIEFFAAADSRLPLCCRREGNHHCAMAGEESGGPMVAAATCPLFPGLRALPARPGTGLLGTAQSVAAQIAVDRLTCPASEALCRISYSRTGQKRGPPTLLS